MAVSKLSQIATTTTAPAATDKFVGVQSGSTDVLFSTSQFVGGATTQVQYNNGGVLAGDTGFIYSGTGSISLYGSYTSATSYQRLGISQGVSGVYNGQSLNAIKIFSDSPGVTSTPALISIEYPYTPFPSSSPGGRFYFSPADVAFDFRQTNSSGVETTWAALNAGVITAQLGLNIGSAASVVNFFSGPEVSIQDGGWRSQQGINFNNASNIYWANSTNADAGTKDVGISRASTGAINVTNGGTGLGSLTTQALCVNDGSHSTILYSGTGAGGILNGVQGLFNWNFPGGGNSGGQGLLVWSGAAVFGNWNNTGYNWYQQMSGQADSNGFTLYESSAAGTPMYNFSPGIGFPPDLSLYRSASSVLEVNNGSAGTFADVKTRLVYTSGFTVTGLPTPTTAGARAYVTDALAPTFLGLLTGGGTTKVPVFYNGSSWIAA